MDEIIQRLRSAQPHTNFGSTICAADAWAAGDEIESLRAENARLTEERDALVEASAYLIDRLTKVSGGIVVRDLEEARGSYDAALAKIKGGPDA